MCSEQPSINSKIGLRYELWEQKLPGVYQIPFMISYECNRLSLISTDRTSREISISSLVDMVEKASLIFKPEEGSVGEGIFVLQYDGDLFSVQSLYNENYRTSLENFLSSRLNAEKKDLVLHAKVNRQTLERSLSELIGIAMEESNGVGHFEPFVNTLHDKEGRTVELRYRFDKPNVGDNAHPRLDKIKIGTGLFATQFSQKAQGVHKLTDVNSIQIKIKEVLEFNHIIEDPNNVVARLEMLLLSLYKEVNKQVKREGLQYERMIQFDVAFVDTKGGIEFFIVESHID